ncbi:DUF2281 domain-containing protein [Crenothrix polyspora]|uniref:DUF2281 domain-containing protein n=1 Tax=Crenothrix polyspora TaxID=360316 RepID=A0A1R4GZC1_9GAMM|nr:DUF2281 domain-containing protein [Crenothrix polyspora]SJM89150.1 hypothetical protein CRENPOLYSF1_100038 [Crenothrix polyspora]
MNPQLVNEITQLPPEAQQEIADFAAFLTARYKAANQPLPPITTGDKTVDPNELFGLWKGEPRTLENIRKAAWQRSESDNYLM